MSDESKTPEQQIEEIHAKQLAESVARNSQPAEETKVDLSDRFAYLNEQAAKMRAERDAYNAKYKDIDQGRADEAKSDRELVEAAANAERKASQKLDPLELIRQVQKMREEGFDEATIRAAFNEVMGELTGNFRRPMRRVLKGEGMSKMLTQEEMNRFYEKKVYGQKDGETDAEMDDRIAMISQRIEDTKDFKVEYKKPTLKNYLYRALYAVLRRPLQFLIRLLSPKNELRSSSFGRSDD